MNRYIIGSLWDRVNRNGANKNFEYLFEGSKRVDALNGRADNILSKSNATLNEAQKTNDMNKDVQAQINTLIAESGTSDAEVLQARGGYSVLNQRLEDSDAQLESMPVYAAYYGVSHTNTAADNTIRLRNALSVATSENRPLILPACPSDTYIDIDGPIMSDSDNLYIAGFESLTRIRQTVFPNPIFKLTGDNCYIGNFEGYGQGVKKGLGGSASTSAVVDIKGHHSKVENIYGDGLWAVVSSNTEGDVVEYVIEGNSYKNIKSGKNVSFNLLLGPSKNAFVDEISGYYSDVTDHPPHLIYITHTSGLTHGLNVGRCYAYGGEKSFAFQFKGLVDSTIDYLYSNDCPGSLHLSSAKNTHIRHVKSENDTHNNPQGAGSLGVDERENNDSITIDKVDLHLINTSNALTFDGANSVIKNIKIKTNHTSEQAFNVCSMKGENNIFKDIDIEEVGLGRARIAISLQDSSSSVVKIKRIVGVRSFMNDVNQRDKNNQIYYNKNDIEIEGEKVINVDSRYNHYASKINPENNDMVVAYDNVDRGILGESDMHVNISSGDYWIYGNDTPFSENGWQIHNRYNAYGIIRTIETNLKDIKLSATIKNLGLGGLVVNTNDRLDTIAVAIWDNEAQLFTQKSNIRTVLKSAPIITKRGMIHKHEVMSIGDKIVYSIDGKEVLTHTLDVDLYDHHKDITEHGILLANEQDSNGINVGIKDIKWEKIL